MFLLQKKKTGAVEFIFAAGLCMKEMEIRRIQ